MPSSMNQRQSSKMDITTTDKFPAGLRILAVDDDPTCLMILAQQLRKCSYQVTMCTRATEALSILRENKDSFDLVISDVYMPDMDGFKLLEYVGLEMDLPVIMTSSHGETSVVMKGVTHGACDYLIKPVRLEELRNIWQHVVRKKRNSEAKEAEASGSVEDNNERQQHHQQQQQQQRRGSDDGEYTSPVNDGTEGNWKLSKRRKDDDENEHEYDDPSTLKKQRVVWSVELHQQFVNAVNHLGIDKAVPKKILELMNVQGLTRENVASHLQKYRLYLRRLSGVQAPSSPGIPQLSHHHSMASIHPQQASLLRNVQASASTASVEPPVLMPMQSIGGYYRSQPPPPLMNIPRNTINGLADSQTSPRTPVNEVPVAGLSVLQHQLANVGGIGRGPVSSNRFLSAADSFGIAGLGPGTDVRCTRDGFSSDVADRNYCSTVAGTGYPARFAADGVGVTTDLVGDAAQDEASNYCVKLECGGSNEADDLFSIILKQQQQPSQVQHRHGPQAMPGFSTSERLL